MTNEIAAVNQMGNTFLNADWTYSPNRNRNHNRNHNRNRNRNPVSVCLSLSLSLSLSQDLSSLALSRLEKVALAPEQLESCLETLNLHESDDVVMNLDSIKISQSSHRS